MNGDRSNGQIQTSVSDENFHMDASLMYSVHHLIYQFPIIKVQKLEE